jgi:amidohydrolase
MLEQAKTIAAQISSWRREFHRSPELGFHEHQTADRLAQIVQEMGCRVRRGVGGTGIIAELGTGDPVVGIRADMDALPIQEENACEYASQVANVMHACGHDSHMAMALGAGALLARESFPGTLRLIFQPAEEIGDENGVSGAPHMIADGAAEGLNSAIALHIDPALPVGAIAIEAGPSSGGVDTFHAAVIGSGGHGAFPHLTVDPVFLSGYIILALHGIVSRRLEPTQPAVLSIGSIHGGDASNVIPSRVEMSGTIRYMAMEIHQTIKEEIQRVMEITRAMGGDYELRFELGYPPMINDRRVSDLISQVGSDLLGADNVQVPAKHLGAEDFGSFTQAVPGAMFSLGCLIEGDERFVHHPRFDIDERCLPIGSAVLAETALRLLRNPIQ